MSQTSVKQVTLTIDTKKVTVPAGTLIVDAAKQAGIKIPVFCYHPWLAPAGMCRMCLVEIGRPVMDRATGKAVLDENGNPKIQFGPKLETSCTTPVTDDMTVVTDSLKVIAARKEMLEFILTSHPLDCPICDKGGECPLQNLTLAYGPGESRFNIDEKNHLAKRVPLGELIFLDRERCIQCGRCVRFQTDIAGEPVIGFSQRGRKLEIITRSNPGFDSIFSGNTTDICPVGALTTADFRFGARPWEMDQTASICNHCPVGCNITYNVRREASSNGNVVIKRVMPRQNEAVNDIWLCDKGRLGYHYLESSKRLIHPMVKKDGKLVESTWEEAFQAAERGLSLSKTPAVLAGGRLTNEDLFNLNQLAQAGNGKALLYSYMAGGDLTAKFGLSQESNLGDLGEGSAILVVASELHEEAPIWWLRIKEAVKRGAQLIVLSLRPTHLDSIASIVIRYKPGQEVETVKSFLTENIANGPDGILKAAEIFNKAGEGIIFYGSDGLGLAESEALASACADLLINTGHIGKPNNGLVAVWHSANLQGAWDMGFRPSHHLAAELAASDALIIAGADPVGDDPLLAEAIGKPEQFVVVQELFLTETAKKADVVFPVQAISEREGTFTSGERRIQRFYPVKVANALKPDYFISAQLAHYFGVKLEDRSAVLVMQQISTQVKNYGGLSYASLAVVEDRTSRFNRADLYYKGTSFENRQGLGIQLEIDNAPTPLERQSEPASSVLPDSKATELLALPVTVLYDQGRLIAETNLLDQRRVKPILWLNSETAHKFGLDQRDPCHFMAHNQSYTLDVVLDNTLPDNIGLLPRSVGIPITGPEIIKMEK